MEEHIIFHASLCYYSRYSGISIPRHFWDLALARKITCLPTDEVIIRLAVFLHRIQALSFFPPPLPYAPQVTIHDPFRQNYKNHDLNLEPTVSPASRSAVRSPGCTAGETLGSKLSRHRTGLSRNNVEQNSMDRASTRRRNWES